MFVVTAARHLPKRVVHFLGIFVLAAAAAAAVGLSMSPAIAGPRHVCPPGQYVKIPPRNQMSDLHGGATTQWLQKCYLVH